MIAFPAGVRVWIAGGVTDMRRGMNTLALTVQQAPYVQDVDRERLAESGFDRAEAARQARGVPRTQNRGTPDASGPSKITLLGGSWQPVGESNPSFQVENLAS